MTQDLTRKRGDTFADEFEIKSETTAAVIDITGYTFTMTVASKKNPADDSFKLFAMTGTITDAVNGLVQFAPSVAQADNTGVYYYDIQMTDTSGAIRTIQTGKYTFTQDITK